jgi:HPr kinase/phosphorylase
MNFITVKEFFADSKSRLHLRILTGGEFLQKKKIIVSDINRPGLALAGFFDYFPYERIQVFGKTEFTYLKKLGREKANRVLERLFAANICCVIVSRNLPVPYNFLSIARRHHVPVMMSSIFTTKLISSIVTFLDKKLAPKITMHGTFVDVYGIGVMIIGKSGIGKSEISLELIKRGHRLVADDLIEVTRLSDDVLEGRGLSIIQHHMEIRGVGIIDIRNLFGVGAVRDEQKIEDVHEDILGVKVPKIILPVKPGRNLSVIIEVAAMTQRLKARGYNPARELNKSIIKWMKKDKKNPGENTDVPDK